MKGAIPHTHTREGQPHDEASRHRHMTRMHGYEGTEPVPPLVHADDEHGRNWEAWKDAPVSPDEHDHPHMVTP